MRSRAFTLIELIVGLAISVVVLLVAVQVYRHFMDDRMRVAVRRNAHREMSGLLDDITKALTYRLVRVPLPGPGIPFDYTLAMWPIAPMALTGGGECHALRIRGRKQVGANVVIALTEIKTACASFSGGINYGAMSSLAACPGNGRPVVVLRRWDDENFMTTPTFTMQYPTSAPVAAANFSAAAKAESPTAMLFCARQIAKDGHTTAIHLHVSAGFSDDKSNLVVSDEGRDVPIGQSVSEMVQPDGSIEIKEYGVMERIQ